MFTTSNIPSQKNTISVPQSALRRNPFALAEHKRYGSSNAAGCHGLKKYTRKTKHKDNTLQG